MQVSGDPLDPATEFPQQAAPSGFAAELGNTRSSFPADVRAGDGENLGTVHGAHELAAAGLDTRSQ